jgi:hypothetical protein
MGNRFRKQKKKKVNNIKNFFLACEFKPNSVLWSVLDPFAYDVKPAFIHGTLGVINYKPEAYSIIDVNDNSPPLLGYVCTITEPTTVTLLDKVKGYNGLNSFNTHIKKLVHAYTDVEEVTDAWCYMLSEFVIESFEQIEQVEYGIWNDDQKQIDLLEKIGESL